MGHGCAVALWACLAVTLGGCCKSKQDEGAGESSGNAAEADACASLLDDGFDQPLGANWQTGTNAKNNPKGPSVTVEQGTLVFSQLYDYVETKQSFSGDFDVEIEGIRRKAGSRQCADVYVELVAAPGQAGIFRFRYGLDKKESINIGKAPNREQSRGWSCIRDDSHLKELDAEGASEGRLRLEHRSQKIRFTYTDDASRTISTAWVPVPAFQATKVRIWGLGGKGTPRTIDRVRICAKGTKPKGAGAAPPPAGKETAGKEGTHAGAEPMPLKKGNKWVYRYRSSVLNGTFSYVAGPKEMVGGVEVVRTEYTDTSGLYGEGYWQLLASRGSRLHFFGDSVRGKTTQPDLWIDSTSKVGDTWSTNHRGAGKLEGGVALGGRDRTGGDVQGLRSLARDQCGLEQDHGPLVGDRGWGCQDAATRRSRDDELRTGQLRLQLEEMLQ